MTREPFERFSPIAFLKNEFTDVVKDLSPLAVVAGRVVNINEIRPNGRKYFRSKLD